jgi:cytochrome P450
VTDASDPSLFDPEMARNPQPMMKVMRDTAPVFEMDTGQFRSFLVAPHDAVIDVLRDPEVFSSQFDAVQIGQIRPLIPLQIDPPEHHGFRKLLDPLFAPKRVAELEPRTRELVAGMIDAVADDGACNFNDAIAEPLPSTVFLDLLGLPTSRTPEFIELKDGIIRPPARSPQERLDMVNETGKRIYAVLEEVVDARTEEPRDDFISGFLHAEVDGHQLSRDEVIDICYLFFLAGLDTVTASLDCMLAFLAQHPEHRRQLADDPSLIPHAVEELLRWETPVPGVVRMTTADTEVAGCPIPKGNTVTVLLASANTDEAAWDRPDEVDFHREVNKHVAFGGGVHRCLGSHLARMELRVTLEEWHKRVPEYELAPGTVLQYSPGLRQIDHLPLVW